MTTHSEAHTSLSFTEEMKGFVAMGETDFQRGREEGEKTNTALMFHLTITMDDVAAFVENPKHEGSAAGYVRCDQFGGQRAVDKGVFNLFVDAEQPHRKLMLYRLFFNDDKGEPLTLYGFKDVNDDPGVDSIWKDTSTLYTRIFRGHIQPEGDATAETVAAGIITIHELDFLKQLTTFRVEGPSLAAKAEALGQFGKLFLGSLWDVYGSKLPRLH